MCRSFSTICCSQPDMWRTARPHAIRVLCCIIEMLSNNNTKYQSRNRTHQLTQSNSQKHKWWNCGQIACDFQDFLYQYSASSMLPFMNSSRPLKNRNQTPSGYCWIIFKLIISKTIWFIYLQPAALSGFHRKTRDHLPGG